MMLLRWQPEYVPTADDLKYIGIVAAMRLFNNGESRTDLSVAVGNRTAEQRAHVDFIGVSGEWAARKCLRLPTRWDDQARKYGADMELNGKTIDVKTTARKDGRLLCRINGIHADAYLLVVAEDPRLTIIGWATSEDVKDDRNTGKMEDRYCINQSELRCVTTIDAWSRAG